jgi:hypothetical protein
VAKIIRIDRRLALLGRKFVLDTGGAPCCCEDDDTDAIPLLLRAVPCAECEPCCQDEICGLPVLFQDFQDWEQRPVFYWAGRCWRIEGVWTCQRPPRALIVRGVPDFFRFADCPSCSIFESDCPILFPACDLVDLVPDSFTVTARAQGSGVSNDGHGTQAEWDFTVTTQTTALPNRCKPGCLTSSRVGIDGAQWHLPDWIQRRRKTWEGYFQLGPNRFDANPDPVFSPSAEYDFGLPHEDCPGQFAGSVFMSHDPFSLVTGARVRTSGDFQYQDRGFGGYFWRRGKLTEPIAVYLDVTGFDGQERAYVGTSVFEWAMTPDSYCCDSSSRPGRSIRNDPGTLDPGVAQAVARHSASFGRGCCGD